ncbi:diacylglycerol/lipid kinase family protein [Anaeromyxobacter diazotrophicus]|uniref:Diacylglycerol kinase n=1 Tax=Anaeromyxobacter diazotrophicus TaxID=2590199 RepID=A0A7I9VP12_9BACT|nr:diacylglycerol kinase family protein [Anaeromyxobacter diazotrophicus]GEJ57948.1 diacylglycerol kinase [Anaeromyxobacter diazotrophicus]
MKPHLIVNPASAYGRTGRHFDDIARAVRGAVGDFDCSFTERRGHGVLLAREVSRAGANLVVAVGGDGTASEVVDGLMLERAAAGGGGAAFGFISRGTGGDLRRSLGCPTDAAGAARVLAGPAERVIDLGRVEFVGHGGKPEARHFVNVAGFGVAGRVVRDVERMGKLLGGKATFMLASAKALMGWRDQPVRWRIDGGPWREDRVTSLAVCNGRFFGGGMMVAPAARLDDGLFDVTLWKGLGLADFALKKGMLYDGSHLRLPNTSTFRGRVVEAEPLGKEPVLLDVDGEQPGVLPARFTLLAGVLRARAPGVDA